MIFANDIAGKHRSLPPHLLGRSRKGQHGQAIDVPEFGVAVTPFLEYASLFSSRKPKPRGQEQQRANGLQTWIDTASYEFAGKEDCRAIIRSERRRRLPLPSIRHVYPSVGSHCFASRGRQPHREWADAAIASRFGVRRAPGWRSAAPKCLTIATAGAVCCDCARRHRRSLLRITPGADAAQRPDNLNPLESNTAANANCS